MIDPVHLEFGVVPHLRTNFCSDSLTYDVGSDPPEIAARAISVGTEIVRAEVVGAVARPARAVTTARPMIEGIDLAPRPLSDLGHPALIADWRANHQLPPIIPPLPALSIGDGLSPYGVDTGIPCSFSAGTGDTCDRAMGLLCGLRIDRGATCFAFPIVQYSGTITLRGWNFWDQHEAQLRFNSIDTPGVGGTASVMAVAADEGFMPLDQCSRATRENPTHNTATFPVNVPSGFYRLTMLNHNGHYYTQSDAAHVDEHPVGRTIHVCYSASVGSEFEPVDATDGVRRGCAQPLSTCAEDGVPHCSAVWTSEIPRPLSVCHHAVGTSPVCGETPEWFASEPRWAEDVGALVRSDAIVCVRANSASPDASVADAGGPPPGAGACGCTAPGGHRTPPTPLVLSVAVAALVRARARLCPRGRSDALRERYGALAVRDGRARPSVARLARGARSDDRAPAASETHRGG